MFVFIKTVYKNNKFAKKLIKILYVWDIQIKFDFEMKDRKLRLQKFTISKLNALNLIQGGRDGRGETQTNECKPNSSGYCEIDLQN